MYSLYCPICQGLITRDNMMTKHHLYPVRYSKHWTKDLGNQTVKLCRKCHDIIEMIIRCKEIRRGGMLKTYEYKKIWEDLIEIQRR